MKISEQGIKLIQQFEGCRLKAYKCSAGKWTIGWGNTYYEDNTPIKEGDTITQERANKLFELLIPKYEKIVLKRIKIELNQNQFDALVSHTYNTGGSDTLFSLINKKSNIEKIKDWWENKYITAGGKYVRGLKRRRVAEFELYIKQ
ncbi:MAG: lysozyme [archaeon]|nr:lysozyme [archaeon]